MSIADRLIVYAVIALLAAGGVWRYLHLEKQNSALKDTVEQLEEAISTAQTQIDAVDARLARKISADAAQRAEIARQEATFEEIKRENPEIRVWADTPIPDRVRGIGLPGGNPSADRGADAAVLDRGPDDDAKRREDQR